MLQYKFSTLLALDLEYIYPTLATITSTTTATGRPTYSHSFNLDWRISLKKISYWQLSRRIPGRECEMSTNPTPLGQVLGVLSKPNMYVVYIQYVH